ncbi:CLUMA_CG008751, isoform A [Clunio marinus]|uniref:CLUMA_CG008751, isoform A n=1 Tax=Clunio marinus TaxID=568069 RepID=A0A1J1I525_9DIPT|nr:CLUMA_CG008751, isoform A [Clunio marinus]
MGRLPADLKHLIDHNSLNELSILWKTTRGTRLRSFMKLSKLRNNKHMCMEREVWSPRERNNEIYFRVQQPFFIIR